VRKIRVASLRVFAQIDIRAISIKFALHNSKKRRSFVALLFAASYAKRSAMPPRGYGRMAGLPM
jgi:hypothetical protein